MLQGDDERATSGGRHTVVVSTVSSRCHHQRAPRTLTHTDEWSNANLSTLTWCDDDAAECVCVRARVRVECRVRDSNFNALISF